MAVQTILVLWFIFALGHRAVGSFSLDATPAHISPVLTESLTLVCTFSYENLPDASFLMSLIISKEDLRKTQSRNSIELLSLTAFARDQVNVMSQLNVSVRGHIGTEEDSFLSLLWPNPTEAESGLYRCEGKLLDDTGHCTDISTTVQVTSSQVSLDALIEKLNMLETLLENQENRQSELEQLVKSQNDTIGSLQSQLDYQWKAMSMLSLFGKSVEYKGHYYLLSKPDFINISASEIICETYNGYLAEIDDGEEHNFIIDFVKLFSDVTRVLLGATDEATEGQWKFRHSGKPMVYTDWYPGEPDQPDNDCMYIYRSYEWKMRDYPCIYAGNHEKFLCEVPLK